MGKRVIRCLQSIQKTLLVLVKIFLAKKTLTVKVKETNLLNYIMYTNKWRNGQKRNDFLARKCICSFKVSIWHIRPFAIAGQVISFLQPQKHFVLGR